MTQTEIGRSENSAEVKIFDETGRDVTENYGIYSVPGLLSVYLVKIRYFDGQRGKGF